MHDGCDLNLLHVFSSVLLDIRRMSNRKSNFSSGDEDRVLLSTNAATFCKRAREYGLYPIEKVDASADSGAQLM